MMSTGGNYESNIITATDWTNTLEANGAVFLPAAGHRFETSVSSVGYQGDYWSSSYNGSYDAYNLNFDSGSLLTYYYGIRRSYGYSVRLVQSVE